MKVIQSTGKRKRAIARAHIKEGNGNILINGFSNKQYTNPICVMMIEEPVLIAKEVIGENSLSKIDIHVTLNGGGQVSGAEASRLSIAKAIVKYLKSDKLKKEFANYDKHLLVADVRRREPRKPWRGGKARAKRQKSYR